MNDIQGYRNSPVESGASRAKEMSPRASISPCLP